jgi:hypothetical protein
MELTWRGYGIILKLERRQLEDVQGRRRTREAQPLSLEHRPEVEQQYLLASGSLMDHPSDDLIESRYLRRIQGGLR